MFVTNVHPALWSQSGASGNVPRHGPIHRAWHDRVRRLLGEPLAAARPTVVVALGGQASREVGRVLDVELRHADGPVEMDLPDDAEAAVVVALAHPSARPATMVRRS